MPSLEKATFQMRGHTSAGIARPRVATIDRDADDYIDYWGTELYNDFCEDLGLTPMEYRTWVALTRERGVDWWYRNLELDDITRFPAVDDYRMYVRTAHPREADGPARLKHYVAKRASGMSAEQVHKLLWYDLGGNVDHAWYELALQCIPVS